MGVKQGRKKTFSRGKSVKLISIIHMCTAKKKETLIFPMNCLNRPRNQRVCCVSSYRYPLYLLIFVFFLYLEHVHSCLDLICKNLGLHKNFEIYNSKISKNLTITIKAI